MLAHTESSKGRTDKGASSDKLVCDESLRPNIKGNMRMRFFRTKHQANSWYKDSRSTAARVMGDRKAFSNNS